MIKQFLVFMLVFSPVVYSDEIFSNEFETLIASRLNTLSLVDPHIYESLPVFGCTDLTDNLNTSIADSIANNADSDMSLDLNAVTQFSTDQPNYMVSRALEVQLIDAICPVPLFSGSCSITEVSETELSTQFDTINECLITEDGTTSIDYPVVINTSAPCYVTEPRDVELNTGTLILPLEAYQQAAQYNGGLTLTQGLHKGFISEATANNIIVPEIEIEVAGFPLTLFGGALSSYLRSPNGQCFTDPLLDDRDIGPDGVTLGWWFYFNSESDLIELH